MPSIIPSKQPLLICSCCPSASDLSLLSCCLILNCPSCLQQHSCQSTLTILPLSLGSQTKGSTSKKCNRCSKAATVKCENCKGKMFCGGCSKIIHQGKFAGHNYGAIKGEGKEKQKDRETERQKEKVLERVKSKKKMLTFQETRPPRLSDRRQNKQNMQNPQTPYPLQPLQTKLSTKLLETTYLKDQLSQKYLSLQSQIKFTFSALHLQLSTKQQSLLSALNSLFLPQLQSIHKMTTSLETSSKALLSLIYIGQKQPHLNYLNKSKKVTILQDLRRIDKKIGAMEGVEYRFMENGAGVVSGLIKGLDMVEKVKVNVGNMRVIDSTSTIAEKSERRLGSKSVNKRALPGLMKKLSGTVVSIDTSRQSIMESPKNSVNNSLHSSRFRKKSNNCREGSVVGYSSPHKYKKTQTGNFNINSNTNNNFKTFYESNKLEECRSSKRLGSGCFASPSPDKSYKKLKT